MGTNFKDVVAKAAKAPAAKKANGKKDVFINSPKDIATEIDAYVAEKKAWKDHETQMKYHADKIIPFARGEQDRMARAGSFMTSFKVIGKNEHITFVSSNRWRMPMEAESELKELCGDRFGDLIQEKFAIKVKDEVLENEKLQNELMKLLGSKFEKFFDVEKKLAPSAMCDEMVYKVFEPDELEEFRALAGQYNPALK